VLPLSASNPGISPKAVLITISVPEPLDSFALPVPEAALSAFSIASAFGTY
jgi:hypothetical protein